FTADIFLNADNTYPLGVAVSPDGTRVYATVFGVAAVYVVDATTSLLVGAIPLSAEFGTPQPIGLAVSPDGARVYVAEQFVDRLAVLDAVDMTELTSVAVGQDPTVVDTSPDGARAYVVNISNSTVSIVDTASATVIGTLLTIDQYPSAGERFIAPGTT